jgi:hypothetical protein
VGPAAGVATADRAGFASLPIATSDGSPVAPAADLVEMMPEAAEILAADIAALRREADLIVVALHKGIVHTPARLAPYERPVAHAAINAGADIVAAHHAHIVRGIELYRGKPIFHGLGNACVVTRALSPDQDHPARAEWAERRQRLFGFEPDPAYPLAPFHPQAVNAMLGTVEVEADGTLRTGMIAVDVLPPGRPVLATGARAVEIHDYVAAIGREAGLPPAPLLLEGAA